MPPTDATAAIPPLTGQLQNAGTHLAGLLTDGTQYCRLLDDVTAKLAALNRALPIAMLRPVVATVEQYLARPATQINLDDFKRLSNSLYRLWTISGRDLSLLPLCEVVAQRFGVIANALQQPLPAVDTWFDAAFTMVFKSAPDWHQAMAWLNVHVVAPYFGYLERVYPPLPAPSKPGHERRRIGYLAWSTELGGSFAIGRILYSIMRGHADSGSADDIFIYDRTGASAEAEAAFGKLGNVRLRQLRHLPEIGDSARIIAGDGLDVLIMEGFSAASFRLAQMRLAPRQYYMPLGMHPMTAPFFDGYLMYENLAGNAFELGVPREKSALLPWRLDTGFLNPPRSPEAIDNARLALPPGGPVFATFCRMEKATEPFLRAMARLLHAVPKAGLLLAGPNDQARIAGFFRQEGLGERVALPGNVDPHVFHPLIDIFVDTFPMCGGLAPVEAMAKGVPAVFLADTGTESSRALRDPALCAATPDEYVAMATRLATDGAFMEARRQAALAIAARTTSVVDTTHAILQHINALP